MQVDLEDTRWVYFSEGLGKMHPKTRFWMLFFLTQRVLARGRGVVFQPLRAFFEKLCLVMYGANQDTSALQDLYLGISQSAQDVTFLSRRQTEAFFVAHRCLGALLEGIECLDERLSSKRSFPHAKREEDPDLFFACLESAVLPQQEVEVLLSWLDWLSDPAIYTKPVREVVCLHAKRSDIFENPDTFSLDDPLRRFVTFRDFCLGDFLPLRAGCLELTWVPTEELAESTSMRMWYEEENKDIPKVTMRIIRWERDKDTGKEDLSDVIEQEMYTPVMEIDSFLRFSALFEGWAMALRDFFVWEEHQARDVYVYPNDCFSGPLLETYKLKKAQTCDDFYQAMKAKRRLGKYGTWDDLSQPS